MGQAGFNAGFYFEAVTFKKSINLFEHMDIAESIYEGVVESYTKNLTRKYANSAG